MSAIQIANGLEYLAQLAGYGCLAGARVAGEHEVNAQVPLSANAALLPLHLGLDFPSYLAHGLLHLFASHEVVELGQHLVQGLFLRHIAAYVFLQDHEVVVADAPPQGLARP